MALTEQQLKALEDMSPEERRTLRYQVQRELELRKMRPAQNELNAFVAGVSKESHFLEEAMNRVDEAHVKRDSDEAAWTRVQQEMSEMRQRGELVDHSLQYEQRRAAKIKQQQAEQVKAEQKQMMETRAKAREEAYRKEFKYIYGSRWEDAMSHKTGIFAKFLTNPMDIAIPWFKSINGARILANGLIGGGIAATEVSVRKMVEKGEIAPEDAKLIIGLGFALPLFIGGGAKFLSWYKGKKANGTKVTNEELQQQADDAGIEMTKEGVELTTDRMNQKIGATSTPVPPTVLNPDPHSPYARYGDPVGPNKPYETQAARIIAERERRKLKGTLDEAPLDENDINFSEQLLKRMQAKARAGHLTGAGKVKEGTRARETAEAYAGRAGETRPAAAQRIAAEKEEAFKAEEKLKKKQEHDDHLLNDIAEASMREDDFIEAGWRRELGNIEPNLLMHFGLGTAGAVVGGAVSEDHPVFGALVGAALGGSLPMGARFLYKPLGKFGDGIVEAESTVGATQAGSVKAASGRLARQQEAMEATGTAGVLDTVAKDRFFGSIIARPSARLDALGPTAREFSRLIQAAEVKARVMANDFMYNYRKVEVSFKEFGKGSKAKLVEGEWRNFAQVMEGTAKPMNKRVARMATFLKKNFDDVINLAVSKGLMTAEKGAGLKKKGYYPHVWDDAKLQGPEGKAQFVEAVSKHGWDSIEEIESAIGHILHGQKDLMNEFRDFITKRGSKYLMSREAAERLLVARRKATDAKRSVHLERPRMLNFPYEVLEPFLVKDPKVVLTQYFYDVSKRFAFVDKFGVKDETAEAFIKTIRDEHEALHPEWGAADHAFQTYYTAVGDTSKSRVLARQASFSDTHKRITGALNAIATWKLTLAPILNMTQVHILGPTYMSKHLGLHTVAKNWHKGIANSMSKEGVDFAMRTAAVFETALMQVLGESSLTHTVWGAMTGKELQGGWKMFDVLNDPAKFLRFIQFVNTEKMNRIVGANMGKAHFESLMDIKLKLDTGVFKGRKAAVMRRKFESAMEEMGLPINKKVWTKDSLSKAGKFEKSPIEEDDLRHFYNEDDAAHAGIMFSDKVNFVNDVTKLPLWWRANPYMRLAMKFKTFSFHFGSFMVDNIVKPMRQGNFKPLATFLALGSPLGMGADEARRLIAFDDRDFTTTERIFRGYGSVGGMGIALDAALGLSSPYGGRVIGSVAGPVGGDIYNLIQGMRMSSKKAIEHSVFSKEAAGPLSRAVVRSVGGGYPGKQALLEELEAMYKSKKKKSSGLNRGNR